MASSQVVIPDLLKGRGFRFTRLSLCRMDGKAPIDKDFYDGGALREDDSLLLTHIEAGNGYGMVCNYGDLMAFDADQGEILEEMGIMARLPPTLTDAAPNKPESSHFYYVCPGLPQTFHFYHPSKLVEVGGGEANELKRLELGQICAGRGHIVGPNSPHHKGGRREIIDDSPLAEITIDDLKAILEGVAFSEDPTKNPTFDEAAGLEEKTGRWDDLEEIVRKARRGRRGDGPSLSERIGDIRRVLSAYGWSPTVTSGDNWKGPHPREYSKSKTALVVEVKKGLWHCKHHESTSGGDIASLVALFEGLITCEEHHKLRDKDLFLKVKAACEEKGLIDPEPEGGQGRGESSTEGARDFIETVKEGLKADPRKLKDRGVLAALLTLRERDPLEFDLLADELKDAGVVKLPTLKKMIDGEERRQADEKARAEEEGGGEAAAGYSDDVMERAGRILERGQPLSFLMEQYHKNHRGDDTMGRGWFCSFASGQSLTSNGIQPAAHSEDPGMGKTDSGKAAFHCIHTRADLETSVSAMSLYRDKTLKPGDIIFSDDVEWSRALASTVKRSMSNFQRETNHTTLDKDNELRKYSLPPRLLWWFTSVESSAIDQIIDRQFLFDVDNSEDHHNGVNDDIKGRRARGTLKFDVDDDILTARCITYQIKKAGPFKVRIPYGDFIVWKLPRGHRDLNRFMDLIDALAILRYPQRSPQKGEDGITWLTATIEDYKEAKRIFASRQKNIRTHLTDAETRLVTVMVERANWTQAELVERTGHKQGTLSKRLAALLEKSSYIKSWNESGEKRFATTDKVDLSLFASDVVGLTLPTARSFIGTDSMERYSTIFHTYSYLIPIFIPTIINSSRNNSTDLFHNPGFGQEDTGIDMDNTVKDNRVTGERNNDGISFGEGDGKTGINPRNQQRATGSTRNKSGIPVEYDGITLDDSEKRDHQSIAENLEEADKKEAEYLEHVKTPEPKGDPSDRPTPKKADQSKTKRDPPEEKDEGRLFEKSFAYWRDLARQHNGLNTRVLMDELGYDDLKAGMTLHALRGQGWKDIDRRLHPSTSEVAVR